jgi:hypothetical protein
LDVSAHRSVCLLFFVSIAAIQPVHMRTGFFNNFVMMGDGTVTAWGSDRGGGLGTGMSPTMDQTAPFSNAINSTVLDVPEGVVIVRASGTGTDNSNQFGQTLCVVLSDQTVKCIGLGAVGSLVWSDMSYKLCVFMEIG